MPERDPGRGRPLRLLRPAPADLIAEATELAGAPPLGAEPLLHGHRFSTGGVWRISWSDSSAVLKVISGRGARTSGDQAHFRWWKREALILQEGVPRAYAEAGIRPPRLLRLVERPDGDLALWLEDVAGEHAFGWVPERYVDAARRLGQAQGSAPDARQDWWSQGFLRAYLAEWDADLDWGVLDSEEAWSAPLVTECWSSSFRGRLARFHAQRPRLLEILSRLPAVFCHLDFWPANMIAMSEDLVLLDWAFAGAGAPGEDIGNLLPDSAFDLVLPAAAVADLVEPVLAAYLEDWPGDPRIPRLGMLASSVKYGWLPVAMLAQARASEHAAYGGNLPADSKTLYRERGLAMEMLFDWADEAVAIR